MDGTSQIRSAAPPCKPTLNRNESFELYAPEIQDKTPVEVEKYYKTFEKKWYPQNTLASQLASLKVKRNEQRGTTSWHANR
jgi:hypothetical protein